MLHAKLLPKVLEQAIGGGVSSVMLLNEKGEPIGIVPPGQASTRHKHTGAIASHVWGTYDKLGSDMKELLFDCEAGRVVAVKVSKFILCLVSEPSPQSAVLSSQGLDDFGMLRRKAHALAEKLEPPLSEWVAASAAMKPQSQQQ